MKKEKSTFGWIMEFAGQKRSLYVVSVIVAVFGALCHIVPFFLMAGIIQKLMAGETEFSIYVTDLILMAVFWALRVVLHSISTGFSQVAFSQV